MVLRVYVIQERVIVRVDIWKICRWFVGEVRYFNEVGNSIDAKTVNPLV